MKPQTENWLKIANNESLEVKLKRYIKSITKSMSVDQVILFGSYANGNACEYSDIDIAIISPELDPSKSRFENTMEVLNKINLFDPDLQLFAYPTELFLNEKNTVHESFIKEIKKTGIPRKKYADKDLTFARISL